jgi:hypothetical protein
MMTRSDLLTTNRDRLYRHSAFALKRRFALLALTSIVAGNAIFPSSAKADAPEAQCTQALNIKVCATLQPTGYELYAQSGSVTSQKTLLPPTGSCPVVAIDAPSGRFRVEGCFAPGTTPKLQGAVQQVGKAQQQAFSLTLPEGHLLGDDGHLVEQGYTYYLDGVRVENFPNRLRQAAIDHLEMAKKRYPQGKVEGYFNGEKIGYELFWDGVRVGFEPGWTRQQAIDNLQQNKKAYPNKRVEGVLNGQKVGYELFWNGVRVGFEPGWTKQQGIDNLRWNTRTYPNRNVLGLFNGEPIIFQQPARLPQAGLVIESH